MLGKVRELWRDFKETGTPIYGEWMTEQDRRRERRSCRVWKATVIILAASYVLNIVSIAITLLKRAV